MNEKIMRQKYFDAYQKFVEDKAFIFEQSRGYIPFELYLDAFRKPNDFQNFLVYSLPWGYDVDLLDQYKEKIVWACSLMMPDGQRRLTVVVQESEKTHLQITVNFLSDEERMACFVDFYTTEGAELLKFTKKNSELVIRHEAKTSFGFGGQ